MAIFHEHTVGLVFICELHENHHERATLPTGWQKIQAGEFQILMAPGWKVHHQELRRVWPHEQDNAKKGWRRYFQAGGSSSSSSSRQQQEAAAGGSSEGSSRR